MGPRAGTPGRVRGLERRPIGSGYFRRIGRAVAWLGAELPDPSTPRGQGKLKRRPRPFRLFLLDLDLTRHRHDPQRSNAVAFAAQDTKTEAVEGETLSALRD